MKLPNFKIVDPDDAEEIDRLVKLFWKHRYVVEGPDGMPDFTSKGRKALGIADGKTLIGYVNDIVREFEATDEMEKISGRSMPETEQ